MARWMIESTSTQAQWTRRIATPMERVSRRELLEVSAAVGLGFFLAADDARACVQPARTPIEGPYALAEPEEKWESGRGLIVKGQVLDAATCLPVAGAVVVRWHANRSGVYEEYYRARMTLPADGRYELSTIPPGQYANLDRHIHWHVSAPGYRAVVAQLQWPGSARIGGTETFDFSLSR
ncbi:MAG: hypothetical protein SFW67_08240 [Myxococcaceae bacterium]|nr:hypothetical protein [Myxococcaceae bacterium]